MGKFFGVGLGEWVAATEWMERMVDKASMYAIRQAGREIRKSARGEVPVLSGTLKKSISNSRNFKKAGAHEFELNVGPHGSPSYLYAGKIEEIVPYMANAQSAIEGEFPRIFEEAQAKVLARFA